MRRLFSAYGMLAVLLALCAYFSWATYHPEYPSGLAAGEAVAEDLTARDAHPAGVAVVSTPDAAGRAFADGAAAALAKRGVAVERVEGDPPAVRAALEALARAGRPPTTIATTAECRSWAMWDALRAADPAFARATLLSPSPRGRSTFLSPGNLRNVADQISVIAIMAIGMTMVIITAGIDLSVGSLVALSAVITAWLIRAAGGVGASGASMAVCSLAAIAACGAVGAFSGLMSTAFRVPPFIATLAMMQVASGLAFILARGQSIYDIPPAFTWLGRGTSIAGLPNAVVLMLVLYVLAHLFMTRTATGRRIYAVGGNEEAARLSGVRTQRTLVFVYVVSALAAGIGGVIIVSQLRAGAPTYGLMYELYVIAAVVVGGTSLSGGEGAVFGTLIGALMIAVIHNGMNLTNIEPYTQKVVLGLVILGAVLLDMLKRRRWQPAMLRAGP